MPALLKHSLPIIALLTAFGASAEVYKWVDDAGRTHYGDRPVEGTESMQIDVDEAPAAAPVDNGLSREEKRRRLLDTMQEERHEADERRAQQKAERERDRVQCNRYRDRMRHYERSSRLYTLDMDGNRVYMSDAERTQATQELQSKIRKYCK